MRSLIVEDDLINRKVLCAMLKSYGDYDIAVNGKEAIQYYRIAMVENKKYDLIFLDIMMPEMDGHEALKLIREIEHEYDIPIGTGAKIIMTTALGDPKNVLSAFSEGCEYYLVKPLRREKLVNLLSELGFESND